MNEIQVVAVRDSAMDAFARPFFVPTTALAVRSFSDEVNRQAADNQMHVHPEDFELVHLATFNEETGEFVNLQHRVLIRGKDAVKGV